MSATSGAYALLVAATLLASWLLPAGARRDLLLVASVLFVASSGLDTLAVTGGVAAVAWAAGRALHAGPPARRGLVYAAAGAATLAPLLLVRTGQWAGAASWVPVGVAFFSLQAFAYVQDVHRQDVDARRDPRDVALLVLFFPKLASGPLERPDSFFAQLDRPRPRTPADLELAVLLVLWGLFKKLVIADHLAPVVERTQALADPTFPLLLGGSIAFMVQLYADFSAWSDLACGVALALGIELTPNFRTPYLSRSLTDFWRRWHISLLNFLRARVYLPLAGGRPGPARAAAALIVTFVVSGAWHGPGANFLLWGLYNGAILALERAVESRPALAQRVAWVPAPLRVLGTLCVVGFGFFLFRETDGLSVLGADLAAWFRRPVVGDWATGLYSIALAGVYGAPLVLGDVVAELRAARGRFAAWSDGLGPRALLAAALVVATLTLAAEKQVSFVYASF